MADFGAGLQGGASGAASGTAIGGFPYGTAVGGGIGLLGGLFGGGGKNDQSELAKAYFESSDIQRYLPWQLRMGGGLIDPILKSGIQGIGDLIQHPGSLSPTISSAIAPRLAAESQNIAQNFRGIGQNQAGASARANTPLSLQGALQSALDVAQERAQRASRGEALSQSEDLRRQDLSQPYNLLNTILQYISSGRGQAIPGLGQAAQLGQPNQASNMALIGSLLSNPALFGGGTQASPQTGVILHNQNDAISHPGYPK